MLAVAQIQYIKYLRDKKAKIIMEIDTRPMCPAH